MKSPKTRDSNITEKDGSYRVVVRLKHRDGTVYSRDYLRHTLLEARKVRDAAYKEYNEIESKPLIGGKNKPMSLDSLFDQICKYEWSNETDKHVKQFRRDYKAYVQPTLGSRLVEAITAGDIQALIKDLSQKTIKSRGVDRLPSASFLKHIYAGISRLYSLGRLHGLTDRNPTDVKVPWAKLTEQRRFEDESVEEKAIKYLDDKQRKALLKEAEGTIAHPILFQMDKLGLRTGESLGTVRSDFDLKKKVVKIWRGYHGAGKYTLTKTRKSRIIPLPQSVIDYVTKLDRQPHQPIGMNADGTPIDPKTFSAIVADCIKSAKLPKGTTAYALRHSFASRMLNVKKASPVNVARVTGHRIETLLAYYSHADEEGVTKMMQDG